LEWKNENLKQSNKKGIFKDTIVSLRRFDSIKIIIKKDGYFSKELISKMEKWKINREFMKTEFVVNYGNILLKKE
jgi:hypothetical protein